MQDERRFVLRKGALMDTKQVIQSQYLAALKMLKQAVEKCPPEVWNAAEDKNRFWHVAYHSLFYTHLYLQDAEKDFQPWEHHRREYQFLGQTPYPPHDPPRIGEPYAKEEILAYYDVVREEVKKRVPALDLEAASGFEWLPFGKLELQFYNIRHLQQHTGELFERLGARAGIKLDWVGAVPQGKEQE
jgi:DinB superfamily